MIRTLLAAVLLTILTACTQVDVTDYADARPLLDIEQFFDGELTAHGVVKDRSGKVIRTFNADIAAHWDDGVGTLVEDFVFDDGEKQQRIWTLKADGPGRYTGTAGDVVGEGRLQQAGNSLFLDYILRLDYRGGKVDVRVDDRMYLVSPDVLINESSMSKFGWRVGNLVLVIVKQPSEE
ncbi:Uncharacterised protein [Halioglobus japonicus]|nr:Uncharacterised protein [Halioglobus japonicus]